MKCTISGCYNNLDCGFLEILGKDKMPKNKDKCSFFKKMDARKNKSTAHQSAELGAETASEDTKICPRKVTGKSVDKKNAK